MTTWTAQPRHSGSTCDAALLVHIPRAVRAWGAEDPPLLRKMSPNNALRSSSSNHRSSRNLRAWGLKMTTNSSRSLAKVIAAPSLRASSFCLPFFWQSSIVSKLPGHNLPGRCRWHRAHVLGGRQKDEGARGDQAHKTSTAESLGTKHPEGDCGKLSVDASHTADFFVPSLVI